MSAPRPEGETPYQRLEQSEVERRANLPMPMNFYLCGWDATAILYAREIVRLRADGATLKVRADEALAAHSASFGALQTLSAALFDGEVDDYAVLAEKIIARVRQLEADGATLRERVRKLPNPVNPENDFNRQHVHVWYCRWCGESWLRNATTSDADHPNNGCLWPEVHNLASAPKEPTP